MQAIIKAAVETKSPVILQVSKGARQYAIASSWKLNNGSGDNICQSPLAVNLQGSWPKGGCGRHPRGGGTAQ